MRTKHAIAVVLTVVCLLPVAAGASNAQQDDPNKTHLDYKVYLPLVGDIARWHPSWRDPLR